MDNNIYPVFDKIVSREEKEARLNQRAKVIWFTGLSGSGKTTLSSALEKRLFKEGYFTQILDGDNIRTGINNNLSFSPDDRLENIRRIAEVSKLIMNCGVIVLCAFISPTDKIRAMAREIIGEEDFIEVFVDTPIEVCEKRDTKGLYAKARQGLIKDFTGISAPFDKPCDADITVDTSQAAIEDSVAKIYDGIKDKIKY